MNHFRSANVLVTGGTGSLGNTLVDTLLCLPVKAVTVFSRDEEKQLVMKRRIADPRVHYRIGNVRDYARVKEVSEGMDFTYHASALKVIPACEENPEEAIKTNLLGTLNVRNACIANKVGRAILISTDKAVKPVNTYGMTKALAEKVWGASSNNGTIFNIVRYGNVIRSRGSVIPFFEKLREELKPFTITHKGMTRFLITQEQAIDLILAVSTTGRSGEVFVPDIPACSILDLAEAIGGEGYSIEFIGIRKGEKIHEVLIHEEEMIRARLISAPDYLGHYIIDPCEIHGFLDGSWGEYTSENAKRLTVDQIRELLKESEA